MRRSITFKFILCYIIIIFLIFTGTNTVGNVLFSNYLKEQKLNNVSITGNSIIESSILKNYFEIKYDSEKNNSQDNSKNNNTQDDSKQSSKASEETKQLYKSSEEGEPLDKSVTTSSNIYSDLISYINIISKSTDIDIWLLDKKQNFIFTTRNNSNFTGKDINKYNPRLLYLSDSDNVYIKGLTPSKSLCKIHKIQDSSHKEQLGYIVLSVPNSDISKETGSLMTSLNILLAIICAFISVIFVLIYFLTIHPVYKLKDYAIASTKGNVNAPLRINSNDEYRELANALIYLSSELNNLDEYQRKFISNISHDFRSPLTSIKGYLEAMLDGTIPPESYDKFIKIILFEAERLTDLTTNLLTLNNLGEHKQMLDKTSFDINYIISKTIEVYEGRCQKLKIKLETNFENIHQFVYADQSKIQQVINNILDNAIKFSPQNSSIVLSTYIKSEKVFISIKDHGKGIPKQNISHIWERFYKTDASRGKDKRGTGLGLSITKEIINAHHENINVTSTEGVGTEFTFSLPKRNN